MEKKMIIKTQLSEKEMPEKFYNISADLPEPLPPYFILAEKIRLVQTTYHHCFQWN